MAFITAAIIATVYAINFSAWWVLALLVSLYFLTVPLTLAEEKRDKKMWLTMVAVAFVCGGAGLLCTTQLLGWGALRMGLAYGLTKGLITAGGAKAILGAIGLGAAATAMKAKEKQKIREEMLNRKDNSNKKTS
ncbi:MAG: hypothetical protein IT342_20720 [Candidatus Melainabacteria bacterium]|nr:hypothetical protein [Candidatus Melainabacteria bacterium]